MTPIQESIPKPEPSTQNHEVRLMVRAGTGIENHLRQCNLMPADREAMRWALHEIDRLRGEVTRATIATLEALPHYLVHAEDQGHLCPRCRALAEAKGGRG